MLLYAHLLSPNEKATIQSLNDGVKVVVMHPWLSAHWANNCELDHKIDETHKGRIQILYYSNMQPAI